MGFWQDLMEARIAEARAKGLFENLRGQGRPTEPDELANLPAEARATARIAASCGGAPPEVDRMRAADQLRRELAALAPGPERDAKLRALRNAEIELALLLERSGRAILLAPPPERPNDDEPADPGSIIGSPAPDLPSARGALPSGPSGVSTLPMDPSTR